MKLLRLAFPLGLLVLALGILSGGARAAASDAPGQSFDVKDCETCHDTAVAGMAGTHHAGVAGRCSWCHGDVTEHLKSNLEKGVPGPIVSLTKAKPADVNATCLSCHDKGRQSNWTGGVHDRRGVACTSCHSVHAPRSDKAQLVAARDADACYRCHPQIRAKANRVSHHPVREGLIGCASCHDPHDSTRPKMISAEYVNEKCLSCHAEKRGPFLWEHAPVRENCLNCHDPHGSNHEKLLVAKQPYLCQRCHLNTRHPGTLYDLRNTLAGPSTTNRAVEHACKNCHQSIHGGNAPSGPYLGR